MEIDYHCKDLPLICEYGREAVPDVTFWDDDDGCFDRSYDFVVASSALQYAEDWEPALRRLAGVDRRDGLLLTRTPVVVEHPSFVVLQRAHRHRFDTEYLSWVFNRGELARRGCRRWRAGWSANSCWATSLIVAGAPEQDETWAFYFRRKSHDRALARLERTHHVAAHLVERHGGTSGEQGFVGLVTQGSPRPNQRVIAAGALPSGKTVDRRELRSADGAGEHRRIVQFAERGHDLDAVVHRRRHRRGVAPVGAERDRLAEVRAARAWSPASAYATARIGEEQSEHHAAGTATDERDALVHDRRGALRIGPPDPEHTHEERIRDRGGVPGLPCGA